MLILCLQSSLKGDDASEAFRVMYGGNVPNTTADIPESVTNQANAEDFHLLSTSIGAGPEQLRPPRVTRIGLVQNKWPVSTSAPLLQQREAIQSRIGTLVEAAGATGVQVCCLPQETALLLTSSDPVQNDIPFPDLLRLTSSTPCSPFCRIQHAHAGALLARGMANAIRLLHSRESTVVRVC